MRVLTGCHAGGDGEVPRVGVQCGQLRFDSEAALSEQGAQAVCRRLQPEGFASCMGAINQGDVATVNSCGFAEFAGGVVARAQQLYPSPIVTEIKPLGVFYEAEDYHQNYYALNPAQGYCAFVVSPKVAHARRNFAHLLR